MSRLALSIDLERCTGCKSCEVACKSEHGLGVDERRNRVLWLADNNGVATANAPSASALVFLPLACQHCDRPACLRACPVAPKAISKDPLTGVVSVDESACVGCGECVAACPYGAMGFDASSHHAVKCDLCADRREAGEPTTACQSVCPTRAIAFGERAELLDEASSAGRELVDFDPFVLGPATVYVARESRQVDMRDLAPASVVDTPGSVDPEKVDAPFGLPAAARAPDRVEPGGCNICFNSCTTQFHFRNDELVKVTGNPDDPILKGRVCPKSQLSLQLHRSRERLTQPLKRVGARGENRFEPISWDQALDEIAARMRQIADDDGPEALAIFSGTRTGTLTNRGYLRMFAQMFGTPNVESTEPFCSSGKNMAYVMTHGFGGSGNSYTEEDMGSAELYVYVGDNQAETRPVHFGMINDWRLRNRATMVVVDPRETVTASKADKHLAIRPGTDLALALALSYHLFDKSLHDQTFCERYVEGYVEWREFVFARGYSPAWAASITDIPAAQIERLAEAIGHADGCVIFGSRGLNQHVNSVQTNRAFMFVAAITGNWGRPGGAYFNMSFSVPIIGNAPEERRRQPDRPKLATSPAAWTEAMREARPYQLKGLIACNNPMALWPGQANTRDALSALDLLVHVDIFANETSAYADYVLPAATGIEKGEIGRACEDRRVVWIDRMIEPPGSARADGWIWIELGKRFGFDDVLKEEWKDPARFWDEVLIDNDMMRGCTQRRLHERPYRWVRIPVADEAAEEQSTLFLEGTTAPGAPAGQRFKTPSGKLEFWTDALEQKFAEYGLSALPEFYGERETLADMPYLEVEEPGENGPPIGPFSPTPTFARRAQIIEPNGSHPAHALRAQGLNLELVTGRPAAPHFHSWTHYAWQAQEMWPDLYVQIHPDTATARGIQDGMRVRIRTGHGSAEARAWVYAGIRPSTVFIPIGWGERQPHNPWQPVNFLTDRTQRCPISDQTNLKMLLCEVEPAASTPLTATQ